MCLSVNSLSIILKNSTKINNNTNLVIAVDIRLNTSEADGCENIYDQAYTQIMPQGEIVEDTGITSKNKQYYTSSTAKLDYHFKFINSPDKKVIG